MVSQTISFNVNKEIMKRLLHQQKTRKRTGLSIDQYAKSLCYERLEELELHGNIPAERMKEYDGRNELDSEVDEG